MSRVVANATCVVLSLVVPLLLCMLYVSAVRGRAFSSAVLHYSCVFVIVASALPFIAILRAGIAVRVAAAIVALPIVFLVTQIAGAYVACVVFGSCP